MRHKSNIVKLFKSLLLTAGFWSFTYTNASHIFGGEISYTNISGKKYKFRVSMYKDCGQCDFGNGDCPSITSLDIVVSSSVQPNYTRLGVIGLKQVSSVEIPGFCKETITTCSSKASLYTGVQQVVFEGYYDFDTLGSTYCKLDIGLRTDLRPDIYGLGGGDNFYNFAFLNLCDGSKGNNTVVLNNNILHQINVNNLVTYNPLANDPDGDSLSYEFVAPLNDFNKSIRYGSSFSKSMPFNAKDLSIDPRTGFISFTPMKYGEQAFMSIQINEWRKVNGSYVKIGSMRRDNLWQVRDFGNNSTRIRSNFDSMNVCIGNELNVDFNVFDNNSTDTVKLSYYFQGKQGKLNAVINSSYASYDAGFSIKIDPTFIAGKTYDLTILSDDGICPWNSRSAATVRIKVFKELQSGFTVKYQNCNVITAKATKINVGSVNTFFLFKDNSLIDNMDGDQVNFTLTSGGRYKVRHLITNSESGCQLETEQEIIVPNFSTPVINTAVWPAKVCNGSEIVLKPSIQKGTAPFTNVWNASLINDSLKLNITKKETIVLQVTDVNGCKAKSEFSISPYPVMQFNVRDTSFCYTSGLKPIELNKKVDIISGKAKTIKWLPNSIMGSIDQSQAANPRFNSAGAFINRLGVIIFDEFGCKYVDELIIKTVKPEATGIEQHQYNICNNVPKLELYQLTRCSLPNGTWFTRTNPSIVTENLYLNPNTLQPGNVQVNFTKKMDEGCFVNDSILIKIVSLPITRITTGDTTFSCNTATNLQLRAEPNGGEWIKPNVFGLINPKQETEDDRNNITAIYKYTDPGTGCSGFDTSIIHINSSVVFNNISDNEVCAGIPFIKEFKAQNASALKLNKTSGSNIISGNRISDYAYTFTAGSTDTAQSICYSISATALKGCPDVAANFCVLVKPTPQIDLKITNSSGCAPLTSEVTFKSLRITPDTIVWNDIEGRHFNITNKSYTLSEPGNYYVDVYASKNGCKSAIAEKVIVVNKPVVSSFVIDPGSQSQSTDYPVFVFRDNTDYTGSYTRQWTFESGSPSSSTEQKQSVLFPKVKGIYTVTLTTTTDKGCTDTKMTKVRVEPGFTFYAPNIITPDKKGPEENEEFKIVTDSCIEFRLLIKNKWGETLFETQDQYKGWNGNANGKPAPNGGYVYLVTGRTKFGRYFEEKGVFTLTR